ncbi:MAG: DUF192 domain-containing protein [bacterium]
MSHACRAGAPGRRARVDWRVTPLAPFALVATLAALGILACAPSGEADRPEAWVEIRGQRIGVEVADEPAEQAKGLGGRDSLDWDRGMIFLYDRPGFYGFWMKGMRFPIDIVWIHEGRIVDLDANVPFEPGGNGPTLRPSSLVDAVLEVRAGVALARGWRIGDRVAFEPTPAPD